MNTKFDVIVVGGGPAGLNAALVLARARRSVLIIDSHEYRNAASHGVHGFLTRDGVLPYELVQLGRDEVLRYGAKYLADTAMSVRGTVGAFTVRLREHGTVTCRVILIATGVADRLPAIEGIEKFYGISVHHCPYCDGWEWRDRPIAVIGRGKSGIALTLKMRTWSTDIVLCTHGPARYSFAELEEFKRFGVKIVTSRIHKLEGVDGRLQSIHFRDGSSISRDAIFFTAPQDQRCGIARELGCELTSKHVVKTTRRQETNIPGVYVAGDAARDVHFAIVAAAEGAKAAVWMDEALNEMDRAKPTNRLTSKRSSNGG